MVRCGQKCYTANDIDFFAIYVIPLDIWYFVPVRQAHRRTKTISLSPHNSLSKHAMLQGSVGFAERKVSVWCPSTRGPSTLF